MSVAHPELYWLPEPPSDWRARLGNLPSDDSAWPELVALAGYRLDSMATFLLDRRLRQHFGETPPAGLVSPPIRLAVLASSTVDHLPPSIRVAALRRGLWLTTYLADYGQYRQEVLDTGSGLYGFQPTAVLFALDAHHMLSGLSPVDDAETVDRRLADKVENLSALWRRAREAFGCDILQHAAMPTLLPLMGANEHRLPGSAASAAQALNLALRKGLDQVGGDLVALDAAVMRDGLKAWYDPVLWHRAKQEIHPLAAPVYGDLVARLLAARRGRSAKCLVLDLDNTLWGGVIGDDGLEGIVLGQGSARGEAHVAFQDYAKRLSQRGVILALASKNEEANGLEPFDKHPDMVLRRSDIAAHAINWTDKASNLRRLAEQINIGLDSLVFVDDNPFERNQVRRELPMVSVPELPEDPTFYAQCVADAGYFESVNLTAEDLERSRQYQANAQRESLRSEAGDMGGYLASLAMELRWRRFDGLGKSRVVQLINKTNQFNLTTRRTTEAEVEAQINDPQALTAQLRLLDQFGDNGVIAIVAGRRSPTDEAAILIETWLMSCRVLGRQVEEATLDVVVNEARRLGAARLIGEYAPSAKNAMVRDHYPKLGFTLISETPDGATRWSLDLDSHTPAETFIRIEQE